VATGCAQLPAVERSPAPEQPLVEGNRARLLIDGPRAHDAMFAAMAAARDHISLETYILDAGAIGERLATLLEKKIGEGVKVNLLYDSVGSIKTPPEYFERLRAIGVAVCEFNPASDLARINNRDHRKILVVDGRVAFTGGINISDAYASSSFRARRTPQKETKEGWRDTQVEVEGPVVAQFQRLFLDGWALQDCGPAGRANYFPPPGRAGAMAMRAVRAEPGGDAAEMYDALLTAIGRARSRVWLTIGYFVPDPVMKQALIGAARRGVDVRLVVPGYSDFWAPVYAGRSHYKELLAGGVHIHEWREALMHAKTAVIDSNWSSIGSTNIDWRSFVHNYEADLVVQDAAFAREMEKRYRRDIAAAVEIDPAAWKLRGTREKVKEWFARRWEYLL
jgi:cardiolipin synthase